MNVSRWAKVLLWIAILFAPGVAVAQCDNNAFGYCADCTVGTPCCGYGPCNFFCGNCDGGCRKAPGGVNGDPSCGGTTRFDVGKAIRATDPASSAASAPIVGRAKFDTIDTNRDGTISLTETKRWAKTAKKGVSKKDVRAGFKDADANGNGKIEPTEFDRGLADAPGTASGAKR